MAEINIKDSQVSVIPETQQDDDEQIDTEIATIRSQIKSLTHRRSILTASLLASPSTASLLTRPSPTSQAFPSPLPPLTLSQTNHNTHNLHRLCTTATTFPVHDPDPHAPPTPLLGIRIEAFTPHSRAHLPPYYLLLSLPSASTPALRIHHHTIPPCIPLRALVAKHLPPPAAAGAATKAAPAQDLPRLVRELRREVAGYHLRKGAVERVRARLVGKGAGAGVKDVRVGDAEGRDVRIEWKGGAVGRVRIGKEGEVERAVVLGEGGRAREVERRLVGGEGRVEGLVERVKEVERLRLL